MDRYDTISKREFREQELSTDYADYADSTETVEQLVNDLEICVIGVICG